MNPSFLDHRSSTLVDLLGQRAALQGGQRFYTFLGETSDDATEVSYEEMDRRARRIGADLQEHASPGDRAVLLYPPGLDYVAAFFGCLYAGVIAVPAYPPDPSRLERTAAPPARHHPGRAGHGGAHHVASSVGMAEFLFEQAPELARAALDGHGRRCPRAAEPTGGAPALGADSLAFLQYTSGLHGHAQGRDAHATATCCTT